MKTEKILFIGDSVTDCGRREDKDGLGSGFVRVIAHTLCDECIGYKIINKGIGGERIRDLLVRWDKDVTEEKPDVLTVLIGINDVGRTHVHADPVVMEDFIRDYRKMLELTKNAGIPRVILMEPFLLPVPEDRRAWRVTLNPIIDVIRALAEEYKTELVPLDGLFAARMMDAGKENLAPDGVHPTIAGHGYIARLWLEQYCG